jgi:Zinc carboxypeptidase/Carboxypeptidase activation peptide
LNTLGTDNTNYHHRIAYKLNDNSLLGYFSFDEGTQVTMFRLSSVLFVASVLVGLGQAGQMARYDNYRVYEVVPNSDQQLSTLEELTTTSDSIIALQHSGAVNAPMHVVVAPHKLAHFSEILERENIAHKVVESNLQAELDALPVPSGTRRRSAGFNWKEYHTLPEIYSWLDKLVQEYPDQVEPVVGGKSYEGREIRGVKVSYKKGNPVVMVESNIHAREWITSATTTYLLNELLTSKNSTIREMAENYDWYIFPVTNPDGFVYTHTKDRMWRKTRRPNTRTCVGTDPNRNWNFHWMEAGTSSQPCSETYGGDKAFSEVETRSFSDFLKTLKGQIKVYLAFHSYSQLLLFPYGHTGQHTYNHDDLQAIGDAAARSLAQRYGTKYKVGNIYDAIYPASGGSMDWAYDALDIPIAYTYELRPSDGWNGFQLPADQIIPTGEETTDSVVTILKESQRLGYFNEERN